MRESTIQAQVRQAICKSGWAVVTRNNTGVLKDERGVPVRFGLGLGSPDLVGMISSGPLMGRVLCLEVKQPGRKPTTHQLAWARACRKRGGFYAVVHSREEALEALARALKGELQ